MNEMIERVHSAIEECLVPAIDGYVTEASIYAAARAAIDAMREPTEKMTETGFQLTAHPCWREDVVTAWQAMIDAALEE